MAAFFHFLDDLRHEGIEVARMTAGDQTLVHHHLFVLSVGTRMDHVGPDGLVRRCIAAIDDARLDQKPLRVADRGDDLALVVELLDVADHVVFHAQQIRVDLAVGQCQWILLLLICRLFGKGE